MAIPPAAIEALQGVLDPEVPVTLFDLGVLRGMEEVPGGLRVNLLPTRLACPGRDAMVSRVKEAIGATAPGLEVEVVWESAPWSPALVTQKGRQVLEEYGYSLLDRGGQPACCPYCRSEDVERAGAFGGAVCKSPFTCRSCGSTFDALRSVTERVALTPKRQPASPPTGP